MRWFSWPAAAFATVAGVGLGAYLADEVGALVDQRGYAEQRSYASLTPQGEREDVGPPEDVSVEPAYAPVYGCTNCGGIL